MASEDSLPASPSSWFLLRNLPKAPGSPSSLFLYSFSCFASCGAIITWSEWLRAAPRPWSPSTRARRPLPWCQSSVGAKFPGKRSKLPRGSPRKSSPFTWSLANIPNFCRRSGSATWSSPSAPPEPSRPSSPLCHLPTASSSFPSFNTFSSSRKSTPIDILLS